MLAAPGRGRSECPRMPRREHPTSRQTPHDWPRHPAEVVRNRCASDGLQKTCGHWCLDCLHTNPTLGPYSYARDARWHHESHDHKNPWSPTVSAKTRLPCGRGRESANAQQRPASCARKPTRSCARLAVVRHHQHHRKTTLPPPSSRSHSSAHESQVASRRAVHHAASPFHHRRRNSHPQALAHPRRMTRGSWAQLVPFRRTATLARRPLPYGPSPLPPPPRSPPPWERGRLRPRPRHSAVCAVASQWWAAPRHPPLSLPLRVSCDVPR